MHCRMLNNIPGLYPPNTSSIPSCDNQKCLQILLMSPGRGGHCPQLRITGVEQNVTLSPTLTLFPGTSIYCPATLLVLAERFCAYRGPVTFTFFCFFFINRYSSSEYLLFLLCFSYHLYIFCININKSASLLFFLNLFCLILGGKFLK